MLPQDLQAIVAKEFNTTAATLTVNPADFGSSSTAIAAFLTNSVGIAQLALTSVQQLTAPDGSFMFQGTASGIPDSLSGTATMATVIYSLLNAEPTLVLAFQIPAPTTTGFATFFPKVAGTSLGDFQITAPPTAQFIFSSYDHTETTLVAGQSLALITGLNFYGPVLPGGSSLQIVDLLFGQFLTTNAIGPVQNQTYGPTMALTLAMPASLDKFFTSLSLPVTLSLVSDFAPDGSSYKAGIMAAVSFSLGSQSGLTISSLLPTNGQPWTTITGEFTNVTLPGPAELARWIGGTGNDLTTLIPPDLNTGLNINSVSISITNTVPPTLAAVSLGVSTATGAGWNVIPGVLNISDVGAELNIYTPFNSATRKATLLLSGSANFPSAQPIVTFEVGATLPRGFIAVTQSPTTPVNLIDLAGYFIPAVKSVAEVATFTLTNLQLSADTTTSPVQYGVGGTVTGSFAFNFGGAESVAVASLSFQLGNNGPSNTMAGQLSGTAAFLGFNLLANYDLSGSFLIDSRIPNMTIDLASVTSRLVGDTSMNAFTWLPTFNFSQTEFLIKHDSTGSTMLSLRTDLQVNALPTLALFFVVQRDQGKWGFAAGIDLPLNGISEFPGLSGLKPFDDVFKLTGLGMVISTMSLAGYQFPGSENFTDPTLNTKSLTIPKAVPGIQAGLYAFATADLSLNQNTQMMQSFLNIDAQIGVSLFLGANPTQNAQLTVYLPLVNIEDNIVFSGSFGGGIIQGELMLFLTGSLTISGLGSLTNNQDLIFATTLAIVENGAFVSGTMQGVLNFDVIKLENLALEIGISFEGIPSLGVACTIYAPSVNNFNSSVAIFVDTSAPQKSMVAGSVSDTNLADLMQATIGQLVTIPPEFATVLGQVSVQGDPTQSFTVPATLATSLDNQDMAAVGAAFAAQGHPIPSGQQQVHLVVSTPGQSWYLTTFASGSVIQHYELTLAGSVINVGYEAQFYLAPANTMIGTLTFPQGFFVSAQLQIFFIVLTTTIEIDSSNGISVDGSLGKIVVWNESFFSLTDSTGTTGPYLSLSTYDQPTKPAPYNQKHFLLSASINILGLIAENAYVNISSAGLDIEIDQKSALIEYQINGTFNALDNFSLGGSVYVGLNQNLNLGALGNYQIVARVGGGVGISYMNSTPSALLNGAVQFMGESLSFSVDLTVNLNGLANIAELVVDEVTQAILAFLKDPSKWLEAIGQGIITGIANTGQAIGEVLMDVYGLGADAAAALLEAFNYPFSFIQDAINVFNNHGDVNMHIDNMYGSHIDDAGAAHQDAPGQHTDNPGTHQDQNGYGGHIDQTSVPHNDSGTAHTDIPGTPHNDQASSHQDQTDHADNGKPK